MKRAKQIIERRAGRRFEVQTGVLAEPDTRVTKISHIVDISMTGMAIAYVAQEPWPQRSHMLNILFPLEGFFLVHLPFEVTYDFAAVNTVSELPVRRRGGRFGRLSPKQISRLKYFIEHFTVKKEEKRPDSMKLARPRPLCISRGRWPATTHTRSHRDNSVLELYPARQRPAQLKRPTV